MSQEKRLLAAFIANFKKGKKIADPMEYAKTCKALVDLYGSPENVAAKLGVGKETVRILSKIVDLPSEVQNLISQGKIPITVAFDLVPLERSKQIDAARAVSGLPYKDARRVIRSISENPDKSTIDIRNEVLKDLEKKEVNIAMIALPKEIYASLQEESQDVPLLINRIVEDWLAGHEALNYSCTFQHQNLVSLTIKFPRRIFMALRRKTRKLANLVEQITISWLKKKGRIS